MNNNQQVIRALKNEEYAQHERNFFQVSSKNKKLLDLSLPTQREIDECYQRTKAALQQIVDGKMIDKSNTGQISNSKGDKDLFVKYTPTSMNGSKQSRMIKIVEQQVDPMLPPKFKNNQKTPSLPDTLLSNTAVLKDTSVKPGVTAEEQKSWYIPPAISNWKNPKGFTIAIDKRLAAFDNKSKRDGAAIGDNFVKLATSLRKADENAREEIKARNKLRLKVAEQKKLENEEKLRNLALKARQNRYNNNNNSGSNDGNHSQADDNRRRRELDRKERLMKYERQLKQSKNNNGLISAPVASDTFSSAPGLNDNNSNVDTLIDARLFTATNRFTNSSENQVYDTPLFSRHEAIQNIYTVNNSKLDKSIDGTEEVENIGKTNRFKVLSGGVDKSQIQDREGAVRFTKAASSAKDDKATGKFGLDHGNDGIDEGPARKKSRWEEEDDEDED
ncbi:mRNA splicing protein [Saccharomycopsis crataegensis]|uniref:Pre-mRNA-processing protein 45 n=1 Tax=Saccharomycopsis crataegensis TaxID=43959 RepID=A0AAV5QMV7_9ASCO|nr:mRNA splicing protein [Saccharomycopsis crataegensis]